MRYSIFCCIIAAITSIASAGAGTAALPHEEGVDGVVDTYTAVSSCMGLDYAPDEGWIWQTSTDTNNGETVTVDPATGSFTSRFHIPDVVGVPGTEGNGLHYDEDDQCLYITDHCGDSLSTYGDAIYCIDVSNPSSPSLLDVWDLGSLDGIRGITRRGSHFYCTFVNDGYDIRKYTLHPGGSYTVENNWNVSWDVPGCIDFKESNDTFYIANAEGWDIYVTDGSDPSTVLGDFAPGCLIYGGITMVEDYYIWVSLSAPPSENKVVEDEYLSFEGTTWGSIKAAL